MQSPPERDGAMTVETTEAHRVFFADPMRNGPIT